MIKRLFLIIILLFISGNVFADTILENFEEDSLPILNEELRQTNKDIEGNISDIATNVTDIATNTAAIAALTSDEIIDADSDTKVQAEESADEDKVRIDTGGTERMIIDSTGIDFKDHQGLNFIIENRTDDTGMTVTGQIWFRTDI